MSYDVFLIGGRGKAAVFRDQIMLLVLRLRRQSILPSEPWSRLALLAAVDYLGSDATPTAVSKELDLKSSNTAAMLRDAEARGYVLRNNDLDDKRKFRLTLTDSGRSVLDLARRNRLEWLERAVSVLSASEKKTLFDAGELMARLAKL